jgi:hypothetical protein
MKSRSAVVGGLMLFLVCLPAALSQDVELKAKVQTYYDGLSSLYKVKNLDGIASLMTNDFQIILAGLDREGARNWLKNVFESYEAIQANYVISEVTRSGSFIKVLRDEKISGKNGSKDWEVITNKPMIDYLVQEGDVLKLARGVDIDKTRMQDINGPMYKDKQAGFSFTVPDGWEILPSVHPSMPGAVLALAPDKSSVALLGYVKISGISAQQAAEGDEALGKALSKPEAYELCKSGPISFSGYTGF